jgi:hypothetical protein
MRLNWRDESPLMRKNPFWEHPHPSPFPLGEGEMRIARLPW